MTNSFQQETSFTRRLRIILIMVAAFFFLGILGVYVASRSFLNGFQEISNVNKVTVLTTTALEALRTSRGLLEKTSSEKFNPAVQYSYKEAGRIAFEQTRESLKLVKKIPEVKVHLDVSLSLIEAYRELLNEQIPKGERQTYYLDVKTSLISAEEGIRDSQFALRRMSDAHFSRIFENRFLPLIVAGVISSVLFGFVIIIVTSSTRKIDNSFENLARATDAVAAGNLDYEAPILEKDEFGKFTYAFNRMVSSLKRNQLDLTNAIEKVTRLQSVTGFFAGTLLPQEVFSVIVMDVFRAVRSHAGVISILSEDGTEIENEIFGYQFGKAKMSIDEVSPLSDCIRTGVPTFFSDINDLKETHPYTYEAVKASGISSCAFIPLVVGKQIYGALNFGFRLKQKFDLTERDFIQALTRQCGIALHRARLFKQTKDAIQVRDDFLSIASHELRTPLTPLKLHLQVLSRKVKKIDDKPLDKDQVLKTVENAERQVDRLINLIDDLLDVTRISSGKLYLNIEPVDMGALIKETILSCSAHNTELKDLLNFKIEDSITCLADRVRIEQVLINLITNAFKYAAGKPIEVRLSRSNEMARIEVEDHGDGINPEDQVRIFERFERVRDKNNIGGLGLGLFICKQIIEAHHGRIFVTSALGKGSTFVAEIPESN